jgi:uncharacterized protein YlaN (UPF0358 family)
MFVSEGFEYSTVPMTCEINREVYDTRIFGIETAIETNKTEVIRKWCGSDTGDTGLIQSKERALSEQNFFLKSQW